MNDDVFLRAMIAAPGDPAPRLAYADWLDERRDPRGTMLRNHWNNCDTIRGMLVNSEANPTWLALVDTLGRPFRPHPFWGEEGDSDEEQNSESVGPYRDPIREPIGTRGPAMTFESAFRSTESLTPGLAEDLHLLRTMPPGECAYGATTCPRYPFIAEWESRTPEDEAGILNALRAADFWRGTASASGSDQIHTNPATQYVFPRAIDLDEDCSERQAASARVHESLRDSVTDRRLWYVVLHSRRNRSYGGNDRCPWVLLFAVGRSQQGDRLIGVVTYQWCRNLCD